MKPLLQSARSRHATTPILLGLLLCSAATATTSTTTSTTTTLIKSSATSSSSSCLGTLTERLQTCMTHNNRNNQTATDCIEVALYQGMSPCLESASELLHACATQGLGLSACLRSSPVYQLIEQEGAGLLPSNNTTSAACRAALETASQTTAGAEALLASGRALLVFGLVGKLLVDFNQTGIPPLYLFYGHVESYGDADGCKTIPGFQYCSAYLDFMPTARAGVCVPQECSLDDLAGFVNDFLWVVGRRSNMTVPEVDLHHVQGQCGDYSFKAGVGTWVMTSITGLLVLLVLAGTWFDYQKQQREKEAHEEELGGQGEEGDGEIDDEIAGAGGKNKVHDGYSRLEERKKKSNNSNRRSGEEKDAFNEVDLEKAPLMNGGGNGNGSHTQTRTQTKQDKLSPSLPRQILSCFSLYRTWPSLVGPARPGQFNALDGVRCFSMSWVVLGHLLVFPVGLLGYTNEDALLPPDGVLGTYIGQAIVSAEFSVDTFFCIGAFIGAYMLTQYLQKENKKRSEQGQDNKQSWAWWPMLYLHRYLRLTPLYFYVILMFMYVMPVVNSGPYWGLLQNEIGKCEKYWWANLLYINTLVPWNSTLDQCYPVSWYMSVDFQLFLLLPLLVVVYVWNKRWGYMLPALLWVASVSYAYWLGYGKGVSQFAFGLDVMDATSFQTEYYFRSWTRAPVYLLGVVFAFFYLDYEQALKQDRESEMDDKTWLAAFARPFANNRKKRTTLPVAVLFVVSFALLGLTCYGAEPAYHAPGLSHFWDYSYLALSRCAWCLGLLILCFLLFQGYGGPILSLLNNPACAVLSRLTFAAYLIHPALINLVFADATLPSHYSPIWVSFNFLGILTAVLLFSAVGYLLVEKPCANLERVFMGGGRKGEEK